MPILRSVLPALVLALGALAAPPARAATVTFQGMQIPAYTVPQDVTLTTPLIKDAQGATAVFTFFVGNRDIRAWCCGEWFYRGPFRPNAVTGVTMTAERLGFDGSVMRTLVKTAYWCRRTNANGNTVYQGMNFIWESLPGCYPDSTRPNVHPHSGITGLVRLTLDIFGPVTTDITTLRVVVTPLPAPVAALGAGLGLLTLLRLSRRRSGSRLDRTPRRAAG